MNDAQPMSGETGCKWRGSRYPDRLNGVTPISLARMAAEYGCEARFGLTDRLPTSDNMYEALVRT